MADESPKRWRCTHGHKWQSTIRLVGFQIHNPDVLSDSIYGLAAGEGRAYCGRCIREWMDEHWGQVREDT